MKKLFITFLSLCLLSSCYNKTPAVPFEDVELVSIEVRATEVTSKTATLNATIKLKNPHNEEGKVAFRLMPMDENSGISGETRSVGTLTENEGDYSVTFDRLLSLTTYRFFVTVDFGVKIFAKEGSFTTLTFTEPIVTGPAQDVSVYSATVVGFANPDPLKGTATYGILYGRFDSSTYTDQERVVAVGKDNNNMFTVNLPDLVPGSKYGYRAFLEYGNDKEFGQVLAFTTEEAKQPNLVELGLSVKWADVNLGATTATEYGSLFAWGETKTKSEYTAENYKWYNDDKYRMGGVLEKEDDVAFRLLGNDWKTPSPEQWRELLDTEKCEWVWTVIDGVNGYLVTSRSNSNSIFLPSYHNSEDYWASRLSHPSSGAEVLSFTSSRAGMSTCARYCGNPVRPVRAY